VTAFSAFDQAMMRRALALAEKGLFTATPNPRVGCVLTHGERVVGEGWHEKAGAPHAETQALVQASAAARGASAGFASASIIAASSATVVSDGATNARGSAFARSWTKNVPPGPLSSWTTLPPCRSGSVLSR